MAIGYVKVKVIEKTTEQPIENAVVVVEHNEQLPIRAKTDANGLTELIALTTVDKSFSYDPDSEILPFYVYQIRVTKQEYHEETMTKIFIF